MKLITLFLLMVLFSFGICLADVGDIYRFQMKDGDVVKGKVLSANKKTISVQTGGFTAVIQVADIVDTKLVKKIQQVDIDKSESDNRKKLVQEYVAKVKKDSAKRDVRVTSEKDETIDRESIVVSGVPSDRYAFDENSLDCDGQWIKCNNHIDEYHSKILEDQKLKLSKNPVKDCRKEYKRCLKENGYVYDKKGELDLCSRERDECSADNGERSSIIENLEYRLFQLRFEDEKYCEQQKSLCVKRNYNRTVLENDTDAHQDNYVRTVEKKEVQATAKNGEKEELTTGNRIDIQQFMNENKDYVDIKGFQEVKFGMSRNEVDDLLAKYGKGKQYHDKSYDAYISEVFPAFDQEVFSQLRYKGPGNTLNHIIVGVMDNFGLGDSLTGIVFMDVSDRKMQVHPTCQDGEKVVKKLLKEYRHVDLHNQDHTVEPGSNAKVEIDNYILNYGTVLMKVRKYEYPQSAQWTQKANLGWYVKGKIIISLEYCDLSQGVKNMESIQKAKQ